MFIIIKDASKGKPIFKDEAIEKSQNLENSLKIGIQKYFYVGRGITSMKNKLGDLKLIEIILKQ